MRFIYSYNPEDTELVVTEILAGIVCFILIIVGFIIS